MKRIVLKLNVLNTTSQDRLAIVSEPKAVREIGRRITPSTVPNRARTRTRWYAASYGQKLVTADVKKAAYPASRFSVSRTVDDATPTRRAISFPDTPAASTEAHRALGVSQSSLLASSPPVAKKPKEWTLSGPAETPSNRATSSRNGGRNHLGIPERHQIGMPGEIIPE